MFESTSCPQMTWNHFVHLYSNYLVCLWKNIGGYVIPQAFNGRDRLGEGSF